MNGLKFSFWGRYVLQLALVFPLLYLSINFIIGFELDKPDVPYWVLLMAGIYLLIWPIWILWNTFNESKSIILSNDEIVIKNFINNKVERFRLSEIKEYYYHFMTENYVFIDRRGTNIFSIHKPFYRNAEDVISIINPSYKGVRFLKWYL